MLRKCGIVPRAIYLSSRSARRAELLGIAKECKRAGLRVTSSWLWANPVELGDSNAASAAAERDLGDLREADLFVGFTEMATASAQGRGGRHLEFGVALALGKRMILVGPGHENIFHHLPRVERYPDWETARRGILGSGG